MRDITKLSGYPRSNDKTRLEQSNYSIASGRFPLQNAIYDRRIYSDITQRIQTLVNGYRKILNIKLSKGLFSGLITGGGGVLEPVKILRLRTEIKM